jgi:putative peptidoglycan lipid II flippase
VLLGRWLDPHFGPHALVGLAIGTLIGGGLQLAVQLPSLTKLGYVFRADFSWRDDGVKRILRLMGPAVIAASSVQLNVMINSMFASTLGDGPIFWLAIAFRLMQLPLGVFGVALATVTLPVLSRIAASGDQIKFRSELARGLRLAFLLTIPATIGLIMLAEPIISVLYQHGKFNAYQTMQAAAALRFYAIGLAAYSAMKVLVPAFYALDRRKTPMIVSFIAVGVNLFFNWLFTFRLGWGHRGLALSTGCVAVTNFLLLYALMRRHVTQLHTGLLVKMLAKVLLAGVALGVVCWSGQHWLLADWPVQATAAKAFSLVATISCAGVAFFVVAALLRITEVTHVLGLARQKLGKRLPRS